MLLLKTLAPCLLVALLVQQVSSVKRRKGSRTKSSEVERAATPAPDRGQRSGGKGAAATLNSGKFTKKDKMQCKWGAKDIGDKVRLSVKCEDPEARAKGGVTELECVYNAKPQSCPGYQSNPKNFWKQVSRALKKLQGKLCMDDSALVKAGMCRRAPRDAHFKLDISTSVSSAQSANWSRPRPPPPRPASTEAGPKNCTGRADHRQRAEDYCKSSWASVCAFFFSMVQGEDC
ncbi:fibroblast growth factor-binding protein 1-like [Scomber japonicus]|uniref:fibroblast growth factor-binding protein 1-like n=1 Tax=Scomber japonicus TaxID=13676 RepID=UPI002305C021|nr:fibroblast growth factor-binding protein 1-like [Scomber japonicus]